MPAMNVTSDTAALEPKSTPLFPAGHLVPLLLVTTLFFLWGIANNLNDVLIREFMKSFAITRFQAAQVQSAFYLGYFVLAMPAALLMRRLGYNAGFVIGLLHVPDVPHHFRARIEAAGPNTKSGGSLLAVHLPTGHANKLLTEPRILRMILRNLAR
jgi:hypothetical protein